MLAEPSPRAVCYECHKPRTLCICGSVPRVDNRTRVVVLQHPRERLHPIGTARFAKLGLTNARVEVAWNADEIEQEPPAWVPSDAALLYPRPDAADLGTLAPHERPKHLVVIDGTWATARTLYRDKAWLRRLRPVRLSPTAPSRYRIRKEPERDYVSTIEAIVEALRLLEPETPGLDALLEAFDRMIDDQLVFIRKGTNRPRKTERRPESFRGTPTALVEDFARLVVTYAESARPEPRGLRSMVHFTAVSLSTGATMERFLRMPSGLPTPTHLAHMQLQECDFARAVDGESFRRDWTQFLDAASRDASCAGQPPLVAAWNQSTLDVLAAETREEASRISLKGAYRSARGGGSGSLDEVIALEKLAIRPHEFKGRARLRIARAVAIAQHLNALARSG